MEITAKHDFWNAENFADHATDASLFWAVVEFDKMEGANMPIAAFMYDQDAKEYAEYLATVGRTAHVVDLLKVVGK